MSLKVTAELFAKIKNPRDYFKGKGCSVRFPTPENIILFYRNCFALTGLNINTDFHYRYVLIFNLGEPLQLFLDGSIVTIGRQEGLLILPYQYHRFINEGQTQIALAFVTFSVGETAYFEELRNIVFPYDQPVLELLHTLGTIHESDDCRSLPYHTALLLQHICAKFEHNLHNMYEHAQSQQLIMQILRAVQGDKSATIKQLSVTLGYSESYLRAYFKRVMGLPLGRFMVEIRLTEAVKLLLQTDHSISEIALMCGYDSIYSFSRSFKTHFDRSPTEYRARHQKENQV